MRGGPVKKRAKRLTTPNKRRVVTRYTEIFELAPIGYALLDPDLLVREINRAGARLLGHARAAVVGRHFETFVAPANRADLRVVIDRAAHGRLDATCEFVLGTRYVRATVGMLPRARRVILLAFVDIGEAREREAKLEAAVLSLSEAERRKDDFMSALSHELRNPLGPIRNSVFVLEHADNDPVAVRSAREIIDRQARHLSRLVDDLLDVSRIIHGKIELYLERFELGEVVRRIVEDHRSSFETSGLVLTVTTEPELWVSADPERVVQIVSNLISNAEKFTPRGGNVEVAVRRDGPRCTVAVIDTGVGIDPSVTSQLFVPFSQAPQSTDRARGGLGLGLAVVKGLIERHGGGVEVTSAGPGTGTTVRVSLPREDAPLRDATPATSS
jgi:PAS domain S-box-containing protein